MKAQKRGWNNVLDALGNERVVLGQHWSYNIMDDPKRLAFVLSRYKFAARMVSRGRSVLELGCSEGVGGILLAEFARDYTGVDLDAEAIRAARSNWTDSKFAFLQDDFLGNVYGSFDAVVSIDVIEHIDPQYEPVFFGTVCKNLKSEGLCIIGTPNLTAAQYASAVSRKNHVNLYDADRLTAVLERYFRKVFLWGMNDEIVHTGFPQMAHFLMAMGCMKRSVA